jgi:hypothetical protein
LTAILLTSLAVVVGVVVWLTLLRPVPPPRYLVQTTLYVAPNRDHILFHNVEGRPEFPSQATQIAMVRSRLVLHVALREDKVAKLPLIRNRRDPVEWLEKQLKADFSISPEIMRIFMVGEDPDALKIIVQAVTEAYVHEIVEKENNKRRNRIEVLREIHNKFEANLQTRKKVLRELVINLGEKDAFAAQQKAVAKQRGELEKQILQIKKELRELRIKLRIQQRRKGIPIGPVHLLVQSFGAQGLPPAGVPLGTLTQQLAALGVMEADVFTLATKKANIPPALLEQLAQQDPVIVQLNKELAQLKKEIAEGLDVPEKGEREPKVQKLRAKVKQTEEAIRKRRQELEPKLIEAARLKVDLEVQGAIAHLEDRIEFREQLQEALQDELEHMNKMIQDKNAGGFDLEQLKAEIKRHEAIAEKAANQEAALEVELQAPRRIQLLQEAVVLSAQANP